MAADDCGLELGAYGNKFCQTPHIDSLAKRGVVFTRAYTSASSCSPSRAALLTGSPSHANGMYGLHHSVHHFSSFDNVTSLPVLLRRLAVYTGLIGKKHVGPESAFQFDFERTEATHSILQVGRNITRIARLVRRFLRNAKRLDKPWLLMVAPHDPHRCAPSRGLGAFCERFGDHSAPNNSIPDWAPIYYQWDEVPVPYNVQDTEAARRDIAAQYTTMSRLDQGVGLVWREVKAAGGAAGTLVVFASDNGPAFPAGRTNLYEPGARVPLIIAPPPTPAPAPSAPRVCTALVSLTDLLPTMLQWFGATMPPTPTPTAAAAADAPRSLLPIITGEAAVAEADARGRSAVFLSQSLHEVTMYYPMRAVRTRSHKLVHNLHHAAPFPIDQDFYVSDTFQDLLNRTLAGEPLPWYKTLAQYYNRPQWELYHLTTDPAETRNLHGKESAAEVERELRARLSSWQRDTRDPWRCAPDAVLLSPDRCAPLRHTTARRDLTEHISELH